jgi:hypothetical protein
VRGQPQGGGGLLGNLLFGRQGIMGLFPQSIQDKGVIGSLVSSLGKGAGSAPVGALPTGLRTPAQPTPSLAGGNNLAFDAQGNAVLSSADYDKTPTTPANFAGTRAIISRTTNRIRIIR